MGVERGIHRSLHSALKVHQIDAFNFNIFKQIFPNLPPDPPRGGEDPPRAVVPKMCSIMYPL